MCNSLQRTRFNCPKCGGRMFGTTGMPDWDSAIGHCHSILEDGTHCDFTWQRQSQDNEVFVDATL